MSGTSISWERDVPIVTSPVVLRQVVIVFLLVPVIMCGLLVLPMWNQDSLDAMPQLALMAFAVSAGVAITGLLGALVILGNRARMRFSVTGTRAVAEVIDRRVSRIGWLSVILGVIARKPGLAGSGLITLSNTRQATKWSAVHKARFHDRRHVIELSNGWRTTVVLFCLPENYEDVAARVRTRIDQPRSHRARNPLWRAMLWTAAIFAAATPSFGLEYPFEIDMLAPIMLLAFAVASLWLIPLLAWATIGAAVLVAGNIALSALALRQSMFAGEAPYRAFEVASDSDWAALGLCLAGLAFLVWMSVQLLRGRIVSVLMSDMIEMGEA